MRIDYLFVFVSRTVAREICFEVYAGYYFRFSRTLCKYYPQTFTAFCTSLQSECWTRLVPPVRSVEIYNSVFHYFFYFTAINFSTVHSAQGMFCIYQPGWSTVKGLLPHWFIPPADHENEENNSQDEKRKDNSPVLHGGKLSGKPQLSTSFINSNENRP